MSTITLTTSEIKTRLASSFNGVSDLQPIDKATVNASKDIRTATVLSLKGLELVCMVYATDDTMENYNRIVWMPQADKVYSF